MMTAVADSSDVYRRHADELVRYATALVGPADAPDVVVDAVVTAFESPAWPTVENQRAYLYRAVLNRSLSMRRSDARRSAREERFAVGGSVAIGDSSIDAQRALAELSPQQPCAPGWLARHRRPQLRRLGAAELVSHCPGSP